MRRFLMLLVLPLMLAACGAEPRWAPDDVVDRLAYRHDGPPSITLFTVRTNTSKEGAHAALMINASQRVMFDPAGSFRHPNVPERNDVLFGITPRILDIYLDFHTRETHHTVVQTVEVPPEVAEQAMRLALAHGAVPKAFCSQSISGILRQLPGFGTLPRSFYPNRVMHGFAALPGVRQRTYFDEDPTEFDLVLTAGDLPPGTAQRP